MTIAYNTAVFARNKKIDCKRTQHRRIYTVLTCRASASLHVTQDSCPCLDSCSCFNTFCHCFRMTDTLCIDNNVMFLTCLTAGNNIIDQFLLIIIIFFRNQNVLCAIGNTAPHCKVACVTSHNLDDTASLMRGRSITHLVNSFHSCIYSCIKANCVFGTCNIQVNGSRYADCVDSKICKFLSSCKRTVSTDNNKTIDSMLSADLSAALLSLCMKKILTEKEGIGRKLDFMAQEMNREANTILSKSNDIEILILPLI